MKLESLERKLEKSRKDCQDSTTDWIVMSYGTVMDDGNIEGINRLGFGETILMEVGMNLEQERWETNGGGSSQE